MKLLSSNLSKPRRRLYSLASVGLLAAVLTSAVGALIVWLGHSQPDVTQPFWECGEYILLLSLFNLGLYAAILWHARRLARRNTSRSPAADRSPFSTPSDLPEASDASDHPADGPSPPAPLPGARRQVSRQVRGNVASLNLDKPDSPANFET